jgi:hypothetical protein
MSNLTDSELKRLIAALEKRKPSTALGLQSLHRTQILAQRRKLAKRLEPFFVKAGFDVDGINKVLTQNQNDLRRILARPPAQAKKTFADAQKTFHRSVENKRKAFEYLAGIQLPAINFVTLDTPFYLWTHDAGIYVDSHTEPYNNWAKIYWDITSDSEVHYTEELRFYFLWTNPSDSLVALNINTTLMLQAYISMGANSALFVDNWAILTGGVALDVWQWGGAPPSPPPPSDGSTRYLFLSKNLHGSTLFDDASQGGTFGLADEYDLNISYFAVPAHANVVFQVSTFWDSGFVGDGGVILVDFANNEFDNKIICPYVQLELYGPVLE